MRDWDGDDHELAERRWGGVEWSVGRGVWRDTDDGHGDNAEDEVALFERGSEGRTGSATDLKLLYAM